MNIHRGDFVRTGLALIALVLSHSIMQRAQADTFTNTGSLIKGRYNYTATCLADGRVLVAGGQTSTGSLASAEIYDPDSGTWTNTGSMIGVRRYHTATLLPDGKVLVAAGYGTAGHLSTAELYDQDTGTWTNTGSLPATRYHHTATLLTNGQVLVAGGYGSGGYLSSAVLYNPATGSWTNTGSLSANRRLHTATLLPNGNVLAAGGWGSAGYLSSAELYNSATGTWTNTGALTTNRYWHTATLLTNGQVLVVGGYGTGGYRSSSELYTPSNGTWTASGSMATARYVHTAALLPNGKVLVGGGANSTNSYLSCATLYDPGLGTWTNCTPMGGGRAYHAAACLPSGRVLVAAGSGSSGSLDSAELFQAAIPAPSWTTTGPMNLARVYHTATLLPNGKVLVAGGSDDAEGPSLTSVELFDRNSGGNGTWTELGETMNIGRSRHTATLLPNGEVLVAGGFDWIMFPAYLSSAELYDPTDGPEGTWTAIDSMNTPRYYHTATLLPNGKVLVAGGLASPSGTYSSELYDPAGSWSATTGPMGTARYHHTATLLPNGKVLVAGGYGSGTFLAAAELYDPASGANGSWTGAGSMDDGRVLHKATLLPNGKVLVEGGYNDTSPYHLATAELYDPNAGPNGTWTTINSMADTRYEHTASLLPNGNALIAGGIGFPNRLDDVELYNPFNGVNGTWSTALSMADGRNAHTATLLPNGSLLVAAGWGGNTRLDTAEFYQTYTAYSLALLFPIGDASLNYAMIPEPESAGSGIAYWRGRDRFLLLDNTVVSGSNPDETRLFELNRSHQVLRTIRMIGFLDPEDIHWIEGDTFVISQERNTGTDPDSIDELVIIEVPPTGDIMNIGNADLRINLNTLGSPSNKGIEAVAVVGADLYFTTEYRLASNTAWDVRKVPIVGGPVTVAFSILHLHPYRATDISGMAYDGTHLWLLSNEGPNGPNDPDVGRILKMTTSGQLIGDYRMPIPDGANPSDWWKQAEGIEFFNDPNDGNKPKLILTGEENVAGAGVDFMLLSVP